MTTAPRFTRRQPQEPAQEDPGGNPEESRLAKVALWLDIAKTRIGLLVGLPQGHPHRIELDERQPRMLELRPRLLAWLAGRGLNPDEHGTQACVDAILSDQAAVERLVSERWLDDPHRLGLCWRWERLGQASGRANRMSCMPTDDEDQFR